MLEPDGSNNGVDIHPDIVERGRAPPSPLPPELSIPKNRSMGNFLTQDTQNTEKAKLRFSFDPSMATEFDRSSIMTEHERGNPHSGLRWIRQQPLSRAPTVPSSGVPSRTTSLGLRSNSISNSMPLTLSLSRAVSMGLPSGPSSPTLNFTEDLSRFPSESLHSFSFAHQSDEFMHNRHNVLKRSMEFLTQRMGRGATNAGIASAQARVSGDQEMQGMLELLARANLVGANNIVGMGKEQLIGPLTGPALADDTGNVFDQSFHTDTIGSMESGEASPITSRRPALLLDTPSEQQVERSGDNHSAIASDGISSRTPTTESQTTGQTSPPLTTRHSLKRTFTDTGPLNLQHKLMDALSQPYFAGDTSHDIVQSPSTFTNARISSFAMASPHPLGPAVHGHSSRWASAAQAIFTTESASPYTILAANDLACLVFGVTKAEVRKMSILEVVQEERRAWLEDKLGVPRRASEAGNRPPQSQRTSPVSTTSFLLGRSGVTASLLSKPNSRQTPKTPRRAQTDDGAGSSIMSRIKAGRSGLHHPNNRSRGVLLCGDVVPIQKRNGAIGSASLWVKEKRGGLIWVLEEIHEDVTLVGLEGTMVTKLTGFSSAIWGENFDRTGVDIKELLPTLPREGKAGCVDYVALAKQKYFTARHAGRFNIPAIVERVSSSSDLRVSSFPHIAGIMVLSATELQIRSANSVFSGALFGQEKPNGRPITDLIPDFDRVLKVLVEDDGVELLDGIVVPEHRFRRARAFLSLREGSSDAASYFLSPDGLPARHHDGSEIRVDIQLRVVKSDSPGSIIEENLIEEQCEEEEPPGLVTDKHDQQTELVYALWITYSRHIHACTQNPDTASPPFSRVDTPHQPSPGQTALSSPPEMESDDAQKEKSHAAQLKAQLKAAAKKTAAVITGRDISPSKEEKAPTPEPLDLTSKKSINDFIILEEMGQGAYGQVKLARYKHGGNKIVLKYVTKRRILVDTWTRDRRLGTVPLEVHVLDYLRRDGLKHSNIVEMADFFEDDTNYYIEMVPHGLPGMDLFDYIELRVNMEENECRSIFVQVANAIHHLHTKALVVHRDIKDENVVLDGEGNVRLIDFGSAAYIKSGPFDVFVGTIDYAAPEVLAGKSYRGKEQDVWALGILLYTIVYKENPFYSIDEIMDRDLRIPYVMSDDSIDLIRAMLDRDVDSRIKIEQVIEHPWCLSALDQV